MFYLLIRYLLTRNAAGSDRARIGSKDLTAGTSFSFSFSFFAVPPRSAGRGTVSALPCPVSRPDGRARGVEDAVEAVPRRGLPYGF